MTTPSPPTARDAGAAKDELRAAIRARRAGRTLPSRALAARLTRALAVCAGHDRISVYASLGDEPTTWPLIDALHERGAALLLPVLAGRREPDWAWYGGRDALRPGWRGIPEPTTDPLGAAALGEVSLVWVSALAATPTGHRLGTGGGWYDRALAHAAPDAVTAVLLDEADVLASVPLEAWDRRVDLLVTEERTIAAADGRE